MKKCVLIFLSLLGSCFADMGSIPFKKGTQIHEPHQDAIIVWNGREQLLYLQTTLSATEATKVLEVMPVPNRPTVEAAKVGVFQRCAFLLPRSPKRKASGGEGDPFGGDERKPVVTVVERKQIGAHDLQVVQLNDRKAFKGWIMQEFSKPNQKVEVPEALIKVIGEYAKDGYDWFIFDVVDLSEKKAKKVPLKIRFKTNHLYYPMRITRTEKGNTKVSLSVFTNVLFNKEDCIGIPRSEIKVPAKAVNVPAKKLAWIDPPILELLGNPVEAKLRSWVISGEIDSFEKDLLIRYPQK